MSTKETLQDSLDGDETILAHGDRARLYEFDDDDGFLSTTKYAVVTPYYDEEDDKQAWNRQEIADERQARITYHVEEQRQHGTEIPVEYVNEGKPAVAAYLYLEAVENSNGYGRRKKTIAYEAVAQQMGVSKQVAKNYVSRYLKNDG